MSEQPLPTLSERQQRWLTSFLVLGSAAFALVVLSYLATYWNFFADVILTFFLAWLLAFILSSPVRLLQRAVPRLPRVVAVVAVYAVLTVVLLALIVLLAQALFSSLLEFIRNVPSLREQLPAILQPWANRLAALGFGQVDLVAQANAFLEGLASTAQGLVGPLQASASWATC
jgi:predicted PurR-regulated permease PerM